MAYEIGEHADFLEVHVSGELSKYEILQIVGALARMDPGKRLPDLWILAEDSLIVYADLVEIAEAIKQQLPAEAIGRKSAFVAADAFHQAQLKLYAAEASILRLEMQVFSTREEAVAWITVP